MKLYIHLVLIVCLSFTWACQKSSPTTTQEQSTLQEVPSLISPLAESHIGTLLLQHTLNQYTVVYEPKASTLISKVGAHVAMYSMRKNVSYQFYILENDGLFSFGLPAGHIFISTGLLKEMQTEAELATILASEVAHIEHQDLIRLMFDENEQKLVSNFQDPKTIEKAWDVVHLKRYPDEVENNADRLGLTYAAHFGYDIEDYTQLLNRILEMQANRTEKVEKGDLDLNFLYHRASYGTVLTRQVQKHGFEKRNFKDQFRETIQNL